jgi:hypothetical protein
MDSDASHPTRSRLRLAMATAIFCSAVGLLLPVNSSSAVASSSPPCTWGNWYDYGEPTITATTFTVLMRKDCWTPEGRLAAFAIGRLSGTMPAWPPGTCDPEGRTVILSTKNTSDEDHTMSFDVTFMRTCNGVPQTKDGHGAGDYGVAIQP